VQVLGDPLPVLEENQFRQPGVEAGVLDRHGGGTGEGHGQFLVDVAERLGPHLVGQVEVPENLLADDDGGSEEGPHRRMVRRKTEAVGMGPQVG
jgi:hypothetical protein